MRLKMLNKVLLKYSLEKLRKPTQNFIKILFRWFSGKIDYSFVHLLAKSVIRLDITIDSILFYCNYILTISTFNSKFNLVVVAVLGIFFKKIYKGLPVENFYTDLRQE